MPRLRLAIHQLLGKEIVPRASALDRITRERERRPGKSNQGHPTVQGASNLTDGFGYILEFASINDVESFDVRLVSHRIMDHRSLALRKLQAETHRFKRQQDVGKNDGRIERKAIDRLERDLRRQLGRLAQLEDRMLRAERTIFCHIPTRLAHEPDRRTIDRLTPAGFEETLVHHFGILETRGRGCQFAMGQALRRCAIVE